MSNYTISGGDCIIRNYEKMPAFSSFLPGLTGEDGIPMWVFYTNRGQAIGSFGINSKNNAITEFFSANAEYENVELKGFRTFIRVNGKLYEPFRYDGRALRYMTVRKNSLRIAELSPEYGIKISVDYFVLPHDCVGALVRRVSVENTSDTAVHIELLDGAAKIIPYGISNGQFKDMSNLFRSWTGVSNLENNAPFFALRASTDDSSEVEEIKGGYFYASAMNGRLMPVIVDPVEVFGYDNSLCIPRGFASKSFPELAVSKTIYNEVPCAFTPVRLELKAGGSASWDSYIGFAASADILNAKCGEFTAADYAAKKYEMAEQLADTLTGDVATHTADPVFDAYIAQSYMDNFLRGGYPVTVEASADPRVLYLYSRKHGDPERDYNWFTIDAEYYSQGNGNFRDVCQNRRNDVFFRPELGDYNIRYFFSLMQTDGYNPLEIRPATFTLRKGCESAASNILRASLSGSGAEKGIGEILAILGGSFRPGEIFRKINMLGLRLLTPPDRLAIPLLELCDENIEAGASEGYWSDHWDYLMDLVDSYLTVWPDRLGELLYGREDYRYYDSDAEVLPRSMTYVKDSKGIWQYGSMAADPEKRQRPGFVPGASNWKKDRGGAYVEVSLAVKLLTLALNKFSTLDSYGMGIEMEGGRPGWNDAMNGLPALFGSGMPETFELVRLLEFLKKATEGEFEARTLKVPAEIAELFGEVCRLLKKYPLPDEFRSAAASNRGTRDFEYWEAMSSLREVYRERTRGDLEGEYKELSAEEVNRFAVSAIRRLEAGISKARAVCGGRVPTYFTFDAVSSEQLTDENGAPLCDGNGRSRVRVTGFAVNVLPMFLEGPARLLNSIEMDTAEAARIHSQVLESGLYDRKLCMFRTSESLEELGMKYGRIRAFTPGWLERESIFLHMEYKYLVALQRRGLYREFFECARTCFVPFMDPEQYGRSTLENSSFIASSANPDGRVHGRGFVARLSGSTTEVLTMWIRMFLGNKGFSVDENGELSLSFEPKLPGEFFDDNGEAAWNFMGRCTVTYINPARRDTFGAAAARTVSLELADADGVRTYVPGMTLKGELAQKLRAGDFVSVKAILG